MAINNLVNIYQPDVINLKIGFIKYSIISDGFVKKYKFKVGFC